MGRLTVKTRRARTHRHTPTIALYGSVAIERGYCPYCRSYSFIRANCFVCCGAIAEYKPKQYERQSKSTDRRRIPKPEDQERILSEQDYMCFYCDEPFGSIHYRNGHSVYLAVTWDHKLPYSIFGDNRLANFVAACQVCNGIKRDLVFADMKDAKLYLSHKRRVKGFDW